MALFQWISHMSRTPFRTSANPSGDNATNLSSRPEPQDRANTSSTSTLLPQSLPPPPPTAPPPSSPPAQGKLSRLPHVQPSISNFNSADSRLSRSGDAFERLNTRPRNSIPPSLGNPRFPTPKSIALLSGPDVPSAPTDNEHATQEPFVIGGETIAFLRDIVELRKRGVAKRIHIKNELRDLKHKRQRVANAQADFTVTFTAHMAAVADRTLNISLHQTLQDAWEELKSSTSTVESREEWLETAQDDLLKLEVRLSIKEQDFYDRFQTIARTAMFSTDGSTALSSSSASSASTASIARKYYNCVGELNLLRERYFNFVSEHRKQKYIREAQRKESQALIPPERVFVQAYMRERENMIQEYVSAKKEMEEIMEVCSQQGVAVAPPNLPAFLDHSNRKEGASQNEAGRRVENKLRLPATYGRTDNRYYILQWMQQVQGSMLERGDLCLEEIRDPPIDTVTPLIDASDIQEWKDRDDEENLVLPSYKHLKTSVSSDDSAMETDIPGWTNAEKMIVRIKPEAFQGEQPKRRYSAPNLHSRLSSSLRLSKRLLLRKEEDDFELPPNPRVMKMGAESLP